MKYKYVCEACKKPLKPIEVIDTARLPSGRFIFETIVRHRDSARRALVCWECISDFFKQLYLTDALGRVAHSRRARLRR